MVLVSNVSSDFQPAEDVDERHEEKNRRYDTVYGIGLLCVPGVGVAG